MTMMMRPIEPEEPDVFVAPRGSGGAGKWVVVLLVLVGGIFAYRHFGGPGRAMADWKSDWEAGLEAAEQTGKPMLVLFTADWCPPCQQMKRDVFADSQVAQRLRNDFTLVKIDLTDRNSPNNQTAMTYGVQGIPTLIRFNERGEQVNRLSGGVPKEALLQWLDARIVIKPSK